ncbi:bifunctional DNA-formamidopyrimidine glycosylase/DNA-(apurinic or apyrimidinic site) lyase [Corynebacterium kozikiae]|uniref:bifunctional DNA-formamidopyrimidine glycosylase/DNA-(apurinic or apyrimidinic site) lyase n=1 Tax=Corynebacterium kozikiae TaxID=2968469 RepID=UPI00211C5108|nr:bifunctional DNA-formamidopyrimidine glycosylase/DNA-(apurinic or apyrimidinic site) lyase [Corynebacterium sp. 76QC2CO]MCQ9342353.1 bifunctional DNA-formamidopyrimidine glycosylase/DNA-(apurinic or apyrimidinic site) lyase [Corynebacterium sp. 76QC2CO]
MPELPEVEVVRRGLEEHVRGRRLDAVEVLHPRAVRHSEGGPAQVEGMLTGTTISDVRRRGKFLWLDCAAAAESGAGDPVLPVIVHLGMSGQMLVKDGGAHGGEHPHLRIRARMDNGNELWFVDQRTFGYWRPSEYDPRADSRLPSHMAHIAQDLLDPTLDLAQVARALKSRDVGIKRLLLDQGIVSGIGNIYADEMLWAARIHPETSAQAIGLPRLRELLEHGQQVMRRALEQGGTSFDALYVNVNGQSGYFDVSLHAYGRGGTPCDRCGAVMRRIQFMNRSSTVCPNCQKKRYRRHK